MFFASQTEPEQAHIASALVFELSKVTLPYIRERVLGNLRNVDEDLATRVSKGLNVKLPVRSKAAVEPKDMAKSPALRIVGKYPPSLEGRTIGILVSDGADGKILKSTKRSCEAEGATVKIVAPKIGGVTLADGSQLPADGQLAGTPSVLFDAVCIILSEDGCEMLLGECAAIDFARNAFGHLKAIGYSRAAQPLLAKAGIVADEYVVEITSPKNEFLSKAKGRNWEREPNVRLLA